MYYHFTSIGEYQVSVDSHGVTITPINKYAQKLKGTSKAATYFYSDISTVELIKPNLIHKYKQRKNMCINAILPLFSNPYLIDYSIRNQLI